MTLPRPALPSVAIFPQSAHGSQLDPFFTAKRNTFFCNEDLADNGVIAASSNPRALDETARSKLSGRTNYLSEARFQRTHNAEETPRCRRGRPQKDVRGIGVATTTTQKTTEGEIKPTAEGLTTKEDPPWGVRRREAHPQIRSHQGKSQREKIAHPIRRRTAA